MVLKVTPDSTPTSDRDWLDAQREAVLGGSVIDAAIDHLNRYGKPWHGDRQTLVGDLRRRLEFDG